MLIPRPIFDAVGGFDEGFFMYCEDVDLSWRARAAGFRTLTCPAALLFHPNTGRVLDRSVHRMFLESGLRMALKWGGDASIAHADRALRENGFTVPDTPDVVRVHVQGTTGFAPDFAHDFAYAPGRW